MSKYIFLYREKDSDDRDACAYIENKPMRFECDHYFGGVRLNGACYCGGDFKRYDEIETVLTENEYQALIDFNKAIGELGYGIKKGDERYKRGVNLCADVQMVYDKLNSDEGKAFADRIMESEKEWLKEEYELDDGDIKDIFDYYGGEYRDRAVVCCVWDNIDECAEDEAWGMGYINKDDDRYFNYEKFGEDLLEADEYLELDDGRIVRLNY